MMIDSVPTQARRARKTADRERVITAEERAGLFYLPIGDTPLAGKYPGESFVALTPHDDDRPLIPGRNYLLADEDGDVGAMAMYQELDGVPVMPGACQDDAGMWPRILARVEGIYTCED